MGLSQALAFGGELMTPGMCSFPEMLLFTYTYLTGRSNRSERCPGLQTNNRAELLVRLILHKLSAPLMHGDPGQAIIRALETTPISPVPLVIKSDSQYAIKCNFFSASPSPLLLLYLPRDTRSHGMASWLAPP